MVPLGVGSSHRIEHSSLSVHLTRESNLADSHRIWAVGGVSLRTSLRPDARRHREALDL